MNTNDPLEQPAPVLEPRAPSRPELLNTISHAVGAGLSAIAATVLVTLAVIANDVWKVVSVSVYGASLVLTYLASTVYHAVRGPLKRKLRRLDLMAIYVLIAGTYTPFAAVALRNAWGFGLLGAMWTLTVVGIVIVVLQGERFGKFGMALYLIMGWLAVVAAPSFLRALPVGGVAWLLAGGILYTVGFVVLTRNRFRASHEVWHFLVLGGSACHFLAIAIYVL